MILPDDIDPITKPRRMDIKDFQRDGYLQEVNRQFFHPLGLALEVLVDTETGEMQMGGIWDYRDDPEGIVFISGPDKDKAQRIHTARVQKAAGRVPRFGWAVQPVGEGVIPIKGDTAVEHSEETS